MYEKSLYDNKENLKILKRLLERKGLEHHYKLISHDYIDEVRIFFILKKYLLKKKFFNSNILFWIYSKKFIYRNIMLVILNYKIIKLDMLKYAFYLLDGLKLCFKNWIFKYYR